MSERVDVQQWGKVTETRCPAVDPFGNQCTGVAGHYVQGDDRSGPISARAMSLHEVCPYCTGQLDDLQRAHTGECSSRDCSRWGI